MWSHVMLYVITSNSPRQNKSKMLCLVSSKGAVHKLRISATLRFLILRAAFSLRYPRYKRSSPNKNRTRHNVPSPSK